MSAAQQQQQMYLTEVPLQDCCCHPSPYTAVWKTLKHTTPISPPAGRGGHSATYLSASVYESVRGCVLIFGGSTRNAQSFNDVYLFDLHRQSWHLPTITGKKPLPRGGHTAVLYQKQLLVYGGQAMTIKPPSSRREEPEASVHLFSDLWSLDLVKWTWTQLQTTGSTLLPARNGHCSLVIAHTLYIIGGSGDNGPTADVIQVDLSSLQCTILPISGDDFDSRELHAVCCIQIPDTQTPSVLLTGGRSENGILNSCYSLDPVTGVCLMTGQAPARCSHSVAAVLTRSVAEEDKREPESTAVLMFAGTDGLTFFNDVTVYQPFHNTVSDTHNTLSCSTCNGPRGWHRIGGGSKADDDEQTAAAHKHKPTTNQQPSKPVSSKKRSSSAVIWPAHRFAHTLVPAPLTDNQAAYFLFGGMNDQQDFNDTLLLQLAPVITPTSQTQPTVES